jgi:ATP-binding protein involved in chromosome partitioning
MKVAIPVSQGVLSPHFGHCEVFALFTLDPDTKQIRESQTLTPPPHEPGILPKWLCEQDVNLVLAGGIGPKAQNLLAEQGVDSIAGCPSSGTGNGLATVCGVAVYPPVIIPVTMNPRNLRNRVSLRIRFLD